MTNEKREELFQALLCLKGRQLDAFVSYCLGLAPGLWADLVRCTNNREDINAETAYRIADVLISNGKYVVAEILTEWCLEKTGGRKKEFADDIVETECIVCGAKTPRYVGSPSLLAKANVCSTSCLKTLYPDAHTPHISNDRAPGKRLRFEVLRRDGFRCVYCGRGVSDGVKLAVDHVAPYSEGGKTTLDNLATSCWDCNSGKGSGLQD